MTVTVEEERGSSCCIGGAADAGEVKEVASIRESEEQEEVVRRGKSS